MTILISIRLFRFETRPGANCRSGRTNAEAARNETNSNAYQLRKRLRVRFGSRRSLPERIFTDQRREYPAKFAGRYLPEFGAVSGAPEHFYI
jgi:hypothetical protein